MLKDKKQDKERKTAILSVLPRDVEIVTELALYLSHKYNRLFNKSEVARIAFRFAMEHKDELELQ